MNNSSNNRRIEWVRAYALNAPTITETLLRGLDAAGLRVDWYRGRPWAFVRMDMGPATGLGLDALRAAHAIRVEKAGDELYHQIYQAGGAVEPVASLEVIAATRAHGYTRDEVVEAMNRLVASGDVVATETFTGLVDTLRHAL